MYIELSGLAVRGAAGVLIDGEGKVQVTDMNLGADFDNAVLHLDNLLGGGDFGETINNLLSALAPTIWDQVLYTILYERILCRYDMMCIKMGCRFPTLPGMAACGARRGANS